MMLLLKSTQLQFRNYNLFLGLFTCNRLYISLNNCTCRYLFYAFLVSNDVFISWALFLLLALCIRLKGLSSWTLCSMGGLPRKLPEAVISYLKELEPRYLELRTIIFCRTADEIYTWSRNEIATATFIFILFWLLIRALWKVELETNRIFLLRIMFWWLVTCLYLILICRIVNISSSACIVDII